MKTRAMWARAAGVLVLVAGTAIAAPSFAQSQGAPPKAESVRASQEADAAFAKGKELYQRKQLKAAYEAYKTAWSLKQSYDIAANLGNTELQLGLKVEAAEHLLFCLRGFPATGNPAQHEQIAAQFTAVRKEVGSILVQMGEDGVEILFNGSPVGRTPLPHEVFVKPGQYVVQARLAGHTSAPQTLDVPAGETRTANLSVLPPEAPAPARVEPPAHGEGETRGPRTEVIVAGAAVAGAGLVAGVVLAVLAGGRDSDADAQREAVVRDVGPAACGQPAPACTALRDSLEDAADLKNAALWTFVGAGAVGLATGAYVLMAPRAPRPAVVAAPAVTARGGAVVIRGTW